MKRSALIAIVAALTLGGALWYTYAEQSMYHGGMMGRGMMMGMDSTGAMGPCMGMNMGMGMGVMTPRQVVPVDDGIIVVFGNKLVKYDKNLNKKKEVTLELDETAIKSMVQQMQKMHSMCLINYNEKTKNK